MDSEGVLLAALVVAGWSFPGVFVRLMPHLNPWTIAVFRLSIGFAASLPVILSNKYREGFLLSVRQPVCWGVALFMFAYYLVATAAFQNAPIGEVALLIATAPAIALPIRWIFGVKPASNEVFGTVLAMAGVACVLSPAGHNKVYPNPALGSLLALTGAICAASFAVGVRRLTDSKRVSSPFAISTMALAWGLLALPVVLFLTPSTQLLEPRVNWVWPLGIFSTALPTACYAGAAGRLSPVMATMLNPMVAVCATIVAAIAIHDQPRIWVYPGAILVVAGIYVSSRGLIAKA